MRLATAFLVGLLCVTLAWSQALKGAKRYGIEYDPDRFPQTTAREDLESVIGAIELKRVNYLLAQLADPEWVDRRVREDHQGKFADLVKETTSQLLDNPEIVKQMRRYAKEGDWDTEGAVWSVKLKDTKDRLFFRKLDTRWFFLNTKRPEKSEKGEK